MVAWFQCLRVGAELNLANILIAKTISSLVLFTRYRLVLLLHQDMVLLDKKLPHHLLKDEKDLFLYEVNEQPSRNLMDKIYPYKIVSNFFQCKMIDEQNFHLPNVQLEI